MHTLHTHLQTHTYMHITQTYTHTHTYTHIHTHTHTHIHILFTRKKEVSVIVVKEAALGIQQDHQVHCQSYAVGNSLNHPVKSDEDGGIDHGKQHGEIEVLKSKDQLSWQINTYTSSGG